TAGGAVSPNYTFTYVGGTLTINAAALTITANNKTKVYGASNPALTVSYSGFVNGDTAASLTTPPTASTTATAASAVGTYPITVAGAVAANYTISYVNGALTVTPATLTITAYDKTRAYGSANPTFTVKYAGFVNGDTPAGLATAPSASTTATAASSVGTYPITVGGAVANANYTIVYVNGTLTVTPAALTVTANSASRAYGAQNPTLTVSYAGFVNGDTAANLTTPPTVSTTATPASAVGAYPITATGAVSANYTIEYASGTLTITPATLTITADNKTKTYGSANPTLTLTYSGFVSGDSAASLTTPPTVATTATAASAVGMYPITVSGGAGVSANYEVTYVNGTLTVTAATLTISADNKSRIYGAANPPLTATYAGFVNGDTAANLTTAPSMATTATASSAVGTYPITASGAVSANYTIAYVAGALTVTPATLTISANNQTRAYGAGNPTLTVSYSGFVNGDTAASLTTPPTVSTSATPASAVGTYPIVATGAAANANYAIAYVNGTLTVTPAVLTITANDQTRGYGAPNLPLTVSYSGFINGDTAASLTTLPAVSTTATAASPAGTYPIMAAGAVSPNYAISYVNGTLTIAPAALTIAADNKTRAYGAANPTLTASYTGFVNGDTAASLTTPPVLATTATSTSAAGTYPITVSGAVSANYAIAFVNGALTVTPAVLTVTANDQTRPYGAANPPLTVSYSGFVNGDTAAGLTTPPTVSSPATAASAVGTYAITASGAVSANYTIAYVGGTLTVTPAALTITADSKSRVYGAANPPFTVSYAGFVNGDTAAALTAAPTVSSTATASSAAGAYPITVAGATAPNYSISYVNGTLTVTQATLTVTANDQTRVYGSANPTLTASYSGFVNGDTIASLTTAATLSTTATTTSAVGTYPITAGGVVSGNYAVAYVAGTLTIVANTAPSFVKGADQAVLEDAAPQMVSGWATAISAGGAPGEAAQSVSFVVSNNNITLFAAQPSISPNGTLTFTAAPNANGAALVTVQLRDDGGTAGGGVDTSAPQTFTITVAPVNDAPAFAKGSDQAVLEDSGMTTVPFWATAISAGPPDEATQTLTFTTSNTNNALFSSQPTVSTSGMLTFALNPLTFGSAIVSVQLHDNGGTANGGVDTSAVQTFSIVVTPINHAPVAADQAVTTTEDTPRVITVAATDIEGSPLTYAIVTPPHHGTLTGTLPTVTYTPAAHYNGADGFTFKANDGALDSNVAGVEITVQAVNNAPSAANDSYTTLEDTPLTIAAPGVLANDTDADGATVSAGASVFLAWQPSANPSVCGNYLLYGTQSGVYPNRLDVGMATSWTVSDLTAGQQYFFVVEAYDSEGLTSPPSNEVTAVATAAGGSENATLTAALVAGPAHGAVTLRPDGGFTYTPSALYSGPDSFTYTASDGLATSNVATVSITVTHVNHAPVATAQSVAINEDVATPITLSAADIDGDALTYSVVTAPAYGTLSGTAPNLIYTPAANYNGGDSFTFKANDGTVDSAPATVSITVTGVNDAPRFTKGADQTVLEDAGAQTVANWATTISAGPADESAQALNFIVSNNNSALFAVQPAISPTGTLTYTPAANTNGSATVTVQLHDNGGTANGGIDTSAAQTFTITVTAVNDAPSFTKGADQTVFEDAGAQTAANWATAISAGPADESAQVLNFIVSNNNSALFAVQPAISPTGTLTYTPAANTNGSATVTVQLHDDGGAANGG
ncbi:MAG TPA: MBG domain-containing protein, partial [Vicinamibacterales bacterium]|nr:MBG domain-containing protein [Vicinamibacterales bacterium]